MGNHSLKT